MKVTISFPDGHVEHYTFDLCSYSSIEAIAEEICSDMAEKYISSKRTKKTSKSFKRYFDGCMLWLYPHLLVAIKEMAERVCKE